MPEILEHSHYNGPLMSENHLLRFEVIQARFYAVFL
jgi:hypothetical protein